MLLVGADGTSIEVDARPGGKRRLTITAAKGGGAEVVLDAESAREVGQALGAGESLTYDDKTLQKVRDGIKSARPYLAEGAITDIIAGIQNAGIYFRENA